MQRIRITKQIGIISILLMSGVLARSANAAEITSIDFKNGTQSSDIIINADGPVEINKKVNSDDHQLILEINGATISKDKARKLDTSSFNSPVTLISPYQVEGSENLVRVVVQLKNNATSDVSQNGNEIKISVANSGAPSTDKLAAAPPDTNTATNSDTNATPPPAAANPDQAQTSPPPDKTADTSDTSVDPLLKQFEETHQTKRFSGKPITLQVRDVDLVDVFRLIGEASGFNILVNSDVKGKVTLTMANVPWDQVLDVILQSQHLAAERSGNLLRIETLAGLTEEKQLQLQADIATQNAAPRITRVFLINYANLNDISSILGKFAGSPVLTTSTAGPAASSSGLASASAAASSLLGQQPLVQADTRTNSLVVRDTAANLEKMKKLIEILDTATPQVMIEGKIVEATESFGKSMGGSLGLSTQGSNQYFAAFNGGNPVDSLLGMGGSPGIFTGTSAGTAASGGGSFGVSPTIGLIPGFDRITAILNLAENDSDVKVIGAPRIVVLNKEQANIIQSTPVLVSTSSTLPGVGPVTSQNIQQANLSLSVTPTVTNEGSILLQLTVSRDVPFPTSGSTTNNAVANRNMTTKVLVDSGTTLVIGGIFTSSITKASSGFPWLRKLPIIGPLFGSESESDQKSELMFFITPRVLNAKDAGLSSSPGTA